LIHIYNTINETKIIHCPEYQFKKIVVLKRFEVKNGVLGLDRDIYLSIVKFLNSSTVRKVNKYFILLFFLSILRLVKNVMNE
jgi:hypothetical protein